MIYCLLYACVHVYVYTCISIYAYAYMLIVCLFALFAINISLKEKHKTLIIKIDMLKMLLKNVKNLVCVVVLPYLCIVVQRGTQYLKINLK